MGRRRDALRCPREAGRSAPMADRAHQLPDLPRLRTAGGPCWRHPPPATDGHLRREPRPQLDQGGRSAPPDVVSDHGGPPPARDSRRLGTPSATLGAREQAGEPREERTGAPPGGQPLQASKVLDRAGAPARHHTGPGERGSAQSPGEQADQGDGADQRYRTAVQRDSRGTVRRGAQHQQVRIEQCRRPGNARLEPHDPAAERCERGQPEERDEGRERCREPVHRWHRTRWTCASLRTGRPPAWTAYLAPNLAAHDERAVEHDERAVELQESSCPAAPNPLLRALTAVRSPAPEPPRPLHCRARPLLCPTGAAPLLGARPQSPCASR